MTYIEVPGYEPALHRDLEPIEQRIADLERAVWTLETRVDQLAGELAGARRLAEVELDHHKRIDH